MKLGEIITMFDVPNICIVVDNNDFYYYKNHRTTFAYSPLNKTKLTENEILNMDVKTIKTGYHGEIYIHI